MPRMSGPEMVEALQAEEPRMRALFVSGYANRVGATPLPEGAELLQKPFTPRDLRQRVGEALELAGTDRQP